MVNHVEIFPWNINFECGIPEIDEQHRKLVELLNTLVSHLAYQSEAPALNKVFDELKAYTVYHFESEEKIWHAHFQNDPWEEWHSRAHEDFIKTVLEIKGRETIETADETIEEIVTFLTHWLALHIVESDKRMAKVVLALHSGISLEHAKDQANKEMAGATRVLIETIMGMYDQLANRTIRMTREINRRIRVESELRDMQAELTKLKDDALASSVAKSTFLANMSHEIRTPMNAILGFTHMLRRGDLTNDQAEKLQKISSAAEHLLSVINDILDISKIEAGKVELEQISFNIDQLIQEVSSIIGLRAQDKGLELRVDIQELPKNLIGDPTRLSQALINYLSNAVKFTHQGHITLRGRVIETTDTDYLVKFEVEDTGDGISPDTLSKLFSPFAQADKSTTRNFGGTGLGLNISKHLAHLMHGEVGVESAEGQGSTFWLTARLGKAADTLSISGVEVLKGQRALVVDDLPVTQAVHSQLLRRMGMRPTATKSGNEAVTAIEQACAESDFYSVILLDLNMPGMDGLQTIKAIQELNPERMPMCILVTASEEPKIAEIALSAGFSAVIVKPVAYDVLQETIIACLHKQTDSGFGLGSTKVDAFRVLQAQYGGRRILLAEDEPINQEIAREMLQDAGLSVVTADNGQEACERAAAAPFDLVLMDMQMPIMSGIDATKAIRATNDGQQIPIIAMTANAFAEDRISCLEAGMNDFVSKPVDPDRFYAILLKWLAPIPAKA